MIGREIDPAIRWTSTAYHYMGSGKMMGQIGKAFAEAMLAMAELDGK